MKKKTKPKRHKIKSFKDFMNVVNEKNVDMLCGNFYGTVLQFIKMRKIVPDIEYSGFIWIDDDKLEVRKAEITIIEKRMESKMPEVHKQVRVYEEKERAGKLTPPPNNNPLYE